MRWESGVFAHTFWEGYRNFLGCILFCLSKPCKSQHAAGGICITLLVSKAYPRSSEITHCGLSLNIAESCHKVCRDRKKQLIGHTSLCTRFGEPETETPVSPRKGCSPGSTRDFMACSYPAANFMARFGNVRWQRALTHRILVQVSPAACWDLHLPQATDGFLLACIFHLRTRYPFSSHASMHPLLYVSSPLHWLLRGCNTRPPRTDLFSAPRVPAQGGNAKTTQKFNVCIVFSKYPPKYGLGASNLTQKFNICVVIEHISVYSYHHKV